MPGEVKKNMLNFCDLLQIMSNDNRQRKAVENKKKNREIDMTTLFCVVPESSRQERRKKWNENDENCVERADNSISNPAPYT
jgi:hypothetical protein